MKRSLILLAVALLLLTACAPNREKLSPRAMVDLKSADVAYNQQDVDEALTLYNNVLADNPGHAHALRRKSDINFYYAENDPDRAVDGNMAAYAGYDKAINIMEKYEKPTEKERAAIRDMKKRRTSAWARVFSAAEAEEKEGNTDAAIKIYEKIISMDDSRTEPLYKLANIYQQELKDEEKAEEILLKIYNVNPSDSSVQQQMGIFYLNKKEYETAITFFERVKDSEPMNVNNLMNLSYCQFELEQFDAAKINNELVLALEPKNEDALSDARYIALKLDDNEAASNHLKKLLDIRDNDTDYQDLCALLNQLERHEELITYARKWHEYDETSEFAVQFVILGAQRTKNKALETEFSNILKRMK